MAIVPKFNLKNLNEIYEQCGELEIRMQIDEKCVGDFILDVREIVIEPVENTNKHILILKLQKTGMFLTK